MYFSAVPLSSHPSIYFPSIIKGVGTCLRTILSTPIFSPPWEQFPRYPAVISALHLGQRTGWGAEDKEKDHVVKEKARLQFGLEWCVILLQVVQERAGRGKSARTASLPGTGDSLVHFRNWKWHCSCSCHLSKHTFLDFRRLSVPHWEFLLFPAFLIKGSGNSWASVHVWVTVLHTIQSFASQTLPFWLWIPEGQDRFCSPFYLFDLTHSTHSRCSLFAASKGRLLWGAWRFTAHRIFIEKKDNEKCIPGYE